MNLKKVIGSGKKKKSKKSKKSKKQKRQRTLSRYDSTLVR